MKIIKKIVNTLKTNQFIRILTELTLLVLLFNIHIILGGILTAIILVEIIIAKDNRNLLYIYLFLSFFDEVLIVDILHGSISRIVMVVIFIKMLIFIIKNKILPNKYQIGLISFFTISFLIGLITVGFNLEVVMIFFNIVIFACFSMVLKFENIEEVNHFIERLCLTIIVAVSNSIFYGIINNNFLREVNGENTIYRFKGTYEPNFMCLYVNLGMLSLLTVKEKFNRKIWLYLLGAIFVNAAISTVSMTGIATLGLSIFLYIIFKRKNWKEELLDLLGIGILTILIFGGIQLAHKIIEMPHLGNASQAQNIQDDSLIGTEGNKNDLQSTNNNENRNGLEKRVEWLEKLLMDGKLDVLTSGRLPLVKTFIRASFDRPVINILLGNDARTKTLYCSFFNEEKYSHNSYVDCLYNFGIIGFFIVIGFVGRRTIKNIYLGQYLTDSKYIQNIKLIRIMLLIYALALSLYTKRMFLVFFLL